MNIKLTVPTAQAHPRKNKQPVKLNKLWRQVQKQRQVNLALAESLDALIQDYHGKVLPAEKETLLPVQVRLTKRLIELFSRKSLSNWHRNEMADWIGSLLEDIGLQDQEQGNALATDYNRVVAEQAGMTVEEMETLQGAQEALQEEVLKDAFGDAFEAFMEESMDADGEGGLDDEALAAAFEEFQEDLFGFADRDDLFEGEHTAQAGMKGEAFDSFEEAASPEAEMDGKWLRQLFRRTAAVLHPDKEQDPQRREQKQQAMAELLDARDKEDVISMVSLYAEHVADGEFSVEATDMDKFSRLLEQQLEDLEEEYFGCIHQSPLHHFVYQNLYAKTAKSRTKKLKAFLAQIEQQVQGLEETIGYLRNLTRLKEVLGERYEQRRFGYFEEGFADDEEVIPF